MPGKLRSRDTDGNSLLSFQGEKGDPGERVCSRRHQCGGSWLGGVLSAHPECEPLSPMCCLRSPTALSLPGQCQPSAHSGGTAKVPKWAGALRGGGRQQVTPCPGGRADAHMERAHPCKHAVHPCMHTACTHIHPHHPAQALIVLLSAAHPGVLLRGTWMQTRPPPFPQHWQPVRLLGAHQRVPNGESSGLVGPHYVEGWPGTPAWPWGPCCWSPGQLCMPHTTADPTSCRAHSPSWDGGMEEGGMEDGEVEDGDQCQSSFSLQGGKEEPEIYGAIIPHVRDTAWLASVRCPGPGRFSPGSGTEREG